MQDFKYRVVLRRLMALAVAIALVIPVGFWIRGVWWRRVSLLDRASRIEANEQKARQFLAMAGIAPESRAEWLAYAEQCVRLRNHCERAAARPWSVPGPDPL